MQGKLAHVIDHRVSRVSAALIPYHHVVLFGQVIHHTTLAFVTPVDTYDRAICHVRCLLFHIVADTPLINNGLLYAAQHNK